MEGSININSKCEVLSHCIAVACCFWRSVMHFPLFVQVSQPVVPDDMVMNEHFTALRRTSRTRNVYFEHVSCWYWSCHYVLALSSLCDPSRAQQTPVELITVLHHNTKVKTACC